MKKLLPTYEHTNKWEQKMSDPEAVNKESLVVIEMIKYINGIQQNLKVPKGQKNKFGGYMYRSCEDILAALKPHLKGGMITFDDDVVERNGDNFLYATAILTSPFGGTHRVRSVAGLEPFKKGMDKAQISGAAISYSHKYALQNMLAIDLTEDADTRDNSNNLIDDTRLRIQGASDEKTLKGIYADVMKFFERGAITDIDKIELIKIIRARKEDFVMNVEVGQ